MENDFAFGDPIDPFYQAPYYPGDVMDTAVGDPVPGDGYVVQGTADGGNVYSFDNGQIATVNAAGRVIGGNVPGSLSVPAPSSDLSLIGSVMVAAGSLLRYVPRTVNGQSMAYPVPVAGAASLFSASRLPLWIAGGLLAFALLKRH